MNVALVSLANRDKKKQKAPVNRNFILSELMYCMKRFMERKHKKKHKSSSRLLMLATTSVCIGCSANNKDAINATAVFFFSNILSKKTKSTITHPANRRILIKWPSDGTNPNT